MEKLKTVTHDVHAATIQAINDLYNFIVKVDHARKTANFLRWKIKNVIAGETTGTIINPTKVTDNKTRAEGLIYYGFDEIYYTLPMAARYLKTNMITIDEAIQAGLIYVVSINGLQAIPQGALNN